MLMLTHEARLCALREELKRQGLDGFVIPISDEHMSEYVGAYAQRLAWLTGFGGSAGSAVVLANASRGKGAAMFIDGRYTVQVRDQVDGNLYDYCQIPKETMGQWIADNSEKNVRIGYDAWLHTRAWADKLSGALEKIGGELVAVDTNPIDAVWDDRPEPSTAAAFVLEDAHAGQSSAEKRAIIADWIKSEGMDAAVIGALDSVAWLLNIRGKDVERTPVALSYVIAYPDGRADLFIAPEKITPAVAQHLGNAVTIRPRDQFSAALGAMKGKKVAVDPDSAVAAIFQTLEDTGAEAVAARDPALLPKAIKNPVEQQGHRNAQARDGAAVSKFLQWLSIQAPKGGETELSAAAQLYAFREQTGILKELSFDTISASGPHGALPHYRVDEDSNIPITPDSVYLVDSGGQYLDGTTDITRTVWIGPGSPSAEVKDRFTRVLKGHIAIATAVFPTGTPGSAIDGFARQFLWQAGLDYAHGTGHGVGSFLSVHEGPQRISKAAGSQAGTDVPLQAGMFLSNEPGYYKAGSFGIRIENLMLVEPRIIEGAEGAYFGFETLTFVPIDRAMVDVSLLTPQEKAWWNNYHARTREILLPRLEGPENEHVRAWVEDGCKPI